MSDISMEKNVAQVMRSLGIQREHPHYEDLTQTARLAFLDCRNCRKRTATNICMLMKYRCLDYLRKEHLYEERNKEVEDSRNGDMKVPPHPLIIIRDIRLNAIVAKLLNGSRLSDLKERDRRYFYRNRHKLEHTLAIIDITKAPFY